MAPDDSWYGVYPAIVTDNKDPDRLGRVKVRLPWAPDAGRERYEEWARVATLMAGRKHGTWFMPDVETEVLVAFEGGDPRRSYVVGALWNGKDTPPEAGDGGNDRKVIRTRSGIAISFDDAAGQEQLVLETPAGQRLTLRDGPGALELADQNGNTIVLEAAGITVRSSAQVRVEASQVTVTASAVTVNAGMAKFSGVVQAETLIATSVVASSYTPGAGNIR